MTGPISDPGKQPFSIVEAFRTKSVQLEAIIKSVAPFTEHGPTVGDASEEGWRAMLNEFLPTRYAVNKAFIVDSDGQSSEQLDIVIHDRHFTPLFWQIGDQMFLPAESVYAVFEVKQTVSAAQIAAAGQKVASVRRLHRTSQRIVHVDGSTDNPKKPLRILGGLLAARSSWSPPFGPALSDALDRLDHLGRLDLGCGLEHGSFEIPEGLTSRELNVSANADFGLATFAMRLMGRLQALGTVPAIDIDAYTKNLQIPATEQNSDRAPKPSDRV
jgi:hypothetical protein